MAGSCRSVLRWKAACGTSALVGVLACSSVAQSQHITDHNLRGFISGKTLSGRTARDNEPWTITFSSDGSFRIRFTNRRVGRGRWSIHGPRIDLMFDRGFPDMCRMVLLADDGRQEWQDCASGQTSSYIVNPVYDRRGPDLNAEMAANMTEGLAYFRSITAGMPIQDNPAASMILATAEQMLTSEARRLLSPEGRRRHAAAALDTLYTGRPSSWSNPSAYEQGDYQVLSEFRNERGHACKQVLSRVIVKGEQRREEQVQCVDEAGRPYAVG
jgi:surface antigen